MRLCDSDDYGDSDREQCELCGLGCCDHVGGTRTRGHEVSVADVCASGREDEKQKGFIPACDRCADRDRAQSHPVVRANGLAR